MFWLTVKTLLAANAAEFKSLPVVCGRISRSSGLDSHPTYGVHNHRAGVGSRESSTGAVNCLVTAPQLEDLTHDTESNFRGCDGAKPQSGRALDALQQLWLDALIA